MNKLKTKRLESIDFLRGIASLSVVLFHITHTKGFLDPEGIVYNTFRGGGEFGVFVFFVISGYIIPYSMYKSNFKISNFKSFFFKRIIRIEPVFVLSIFFTASIYIILSRLPDIYWGWGEYNVDFSNFILHLGYLISFVASENWINPVYWSLGIEFQYYLLIGLIYPAFVGNKKLLNTLFLLVVTILCWAIFLILIKGTYLHYGSLIFQYFPVFIVGITIFQLKENLISKYSYVLINILIIGLCFTEFKLGVILAILFATIVLFLMKKSPKIFLFLGKISFSMYLLHVPLGGGFSKLIIPHVKDDSTRTILILLSVIPIIVISWLFYKIVEEPCISLSKRIKY